jgi:hypothetical protein
VLLWFIGGLQAQFKSAAVVLAIESAQKAKEAAQKAKEGAKVTHSAKRDIVSVTRSRYHEVKRTLMCFFS